MAENDAGLGGSDPEALNAVLAAVMDVSWSWVAPVALLALASCFQISHPAAGGVGIEFDVSATTLGVVALIWLPSLVRAWSLVGGKFEAAGMTASSEGLLGSPEDLIERLTGLKTTAEKAKEQAPEAADVLTSLDQEVDQIASEYLVGVGAVNERAIEALARRYEDLREKRPPGGARTVEMTRVLNEARIRAEADPRLAEQWALPLIRHQDPGKRLVGLAFLQVNPVHGALSELLGVVRNSASAFEMFQAVVALGEMTDLLTTAEKRRVASTLLDELERDPRRVGVASDSGLPPLIRQVVSGLDLPASAQS